MGDYASLTMFVRVVTQSLPMRLIAHFHGLKEESTTLHQAASKNMLTPAEQISIFLKISYTLYLVHSKGYLNNGIRENNVLLERNSTLEYNPCMLVALKVPNYFPYP